MPLLLVVFFQFFKHTDVCHSFVLKPRLQQCTQWESCPMEPLVVDTSTLLTAKHEAERTVLCWCARGWRINSLLQHFFTHFFTEDSSPEVGPHPPGSYAWSDTHLLFTAGAAGGKWAIGWPTSARPSLKTPQSDLRHVKRAGAKGLTPQRPQKGTG